MQYTSPEELLKKYATLVMEQTGTDFTSKINSEDSKVYFTMNDIESLTILLEEAKDEY